MSGAVAKPKHARRLIDHFRWYEKVVWGEFPLRYRRLSRFINDLSALVKSDSSHSDLRTKLGKYGIDFERRSWFQRHFNRLIANIGRTKRAAALAIQ